MNSIYNPAHVQRDTSIAAYQQALARAPNLRMKIWHALDTFGPHSADEIASLLGESILSVRPQVTALCKEAKIEETGDTVKNPSGRDAMVWRARPRPEWGTAPSHLTPAEKINLLKAEINRLRYICSTHHIDWRKEKIL